MTYHNCFFKICGKTRNIWTAIKEEFYFNDFNSINISIRVFYAGTQVWREGF